MSKNAFSQFFKIQMTLLGGILSSSDVYAEKSLITRADFKFQMPSHAGKFWASLQFNFKKRVRFFVYFSRDFKHFLAFQWALNFCRISLDAVTKEGALIRLYLSQNYKKKEIAGPSKNAVSQNDCFDHTFDYRNDDSYREIQENLDRCSRCYLKDLDEKSSTMQEPKTDCLEPKKMDQKTIVKENEHSFFTVVSKFLLAVIRASSKKYEFFLRQVWSFNSQSGTNLRNRF